MSQVEWETQSVQIRNRMIRLRRKLDHEVDDIVSQAQSMMDWRGHVRRNPWAVAGIAAAVGFLIMPGRRVTPAVKLDEKTISELTRHTQQALRQPAKPEKQTFLKGALVALSGILLRQVVAAGSARVEQYINGVAKGYQHPRAPQDEEPRGANNPRPLHGAN